MMDRFSTPDTWRLVPSPESLGLLVGDYRTHAGAVAMIGRFDALRSAERSLLVIHPRPSSTPDRVVALAMACRRPVHVVAPASWRHDHGVRDLAELTLTWGRDIVTRWYGDPRAALERTLGTIAEHDVVGFLWPTSSALELWAYIRQMVRRRAEGSSPLHG